MLEESFARQTLQVEKEARGLFEGFMQDRNVPRDLVASVLRSQKPQFTDADIQSALEYVVELRGRAAFSPPLDLSSIIGLVKEGPPSDAAQDLDEEIYGGE